MGDKVGMWQTKSQQRADEVSRAMVRIGVMTHGQITRLLQVNPNVERELMFHHWDRFEEQHKIAKGIAGGRYVVPGNRVMKLVRLSDEAMKEWATREGLRLARNRVRPTMLPQTLNVGEILIRLRQEKLLYDQWDMTLPQDGEGLHACLITRGQEDEFKLGLFILPMRLSKQEEGKKGFIFHGVLRRVTQHNAKSNLLFLVPRKYYATVLRTLTQMDSLGSFLYLLPLEAFLAEPAWYLDAIVDDEGTQRKTLVDRFLPHQGKLSFPIQYDYAALLQYGGEEYGFVDTFINGDIERARNWWKDTMGYQIPGTGSVAVPNVYVFDDTMREALSTLTKTKWRGSKERCVVSVLPWPDGLITPADRSKLAKGGNWTPDDPSAIDLDDDTWIEEFNQ